MGLLSGTFTFTKYRVWGEEPVSFREFVDERLRRYAFREIESTPEERTYGWVGLGNVVDTEFENANYSMGDYLAFSFRVDRRSVPGALLKKHVIEEEERIRQKTDRKFLAKRERTEIKDRVHAVLLSKAMAVPALIDICWCVSERWLVFGSTASKAIEDFERLFKLTFELHLTPFLPWDAKYIEPDTQRLVDALNPEPFF